MSGGRAPSRPAGGSRPARRGTGLFIAQRVTAVALMLLAFAYVAELVTLPGSGYEAIRDHIANPLMAISLLVFILAGVWHMVIGMQVIIEDYVHAAGAKRLALAANILFSVGVGTACLWAVLKIGFLP